MLQRPWRTQNRLGGQLPNHLVLPAHLGLVEAALVVSGPLVLCPRGLLLLLVTLPISSLIGLVLLEPLREETAELVEGPGGNCIKIGLPGKSILRDYFQEDFPRFA